jgi:hypothetical protein
MCSRRLLCLCCEMWVITNGERLTEYDIMVCRGGIFWTRHASATRIYAKWTKEDHIVAHESAFD